MPEEIVLRFKGWKIAIVFLPLFLLMFVSIALNPEGWLKIDWHIPLVGGMWLGILSLCILVPRRYYLRLSPDGLELHYLIGGRRFYTWDQVENFRVRKMRNPTNVPTKANLVLFDLTRSAPQRSMLQQILRFFNRYDHSIFAGFDLNAEDLADLLNDWQRHYGRKQPPE